MSEQKINKQIIVKVQIHNYTVQSVIEEQLTFSNSTNMKFQTEFFKISN